MALGAIFGIRLTKRAPSGGQQSKWSGKQVHHRRDGETILRGTQRRFYGLSDTRATAALFRNLDICGTTLSTLLCRYVVQRARNDLHTSGGLISKSDLTMPDDHENVIASRCRKFFQILRRKSDPAAYYLRTQSKGMIKET